MVTSEESQNFYHFHDNRVLPSHVDEVMATRDGAHLSPTLNSESLHSVSIHSPTKDPSAALLLDYM